MKKFLDFCGGCGILPDHVAIQLSPRPRPRLDGNSQGRISETSFNNSIECFPLFLCWRKGAVYLEEDCDMPLVLEHYKEEGVEVQLNVVNHPGEANIRNLRSYTLV